MTKRDETYFKKLLKCDTVRISGGYTRVFLIIGFKKRSEGECFKDTHGKEPVNFDYIAEQTIASGSDLKELKKSVREYVRITKMTSGEYLRELIGINLSS